MIELTKKPSLIKNCNNRQLVLESVTRYGFNLENACDDLKNDREIVMAAVTQNGNSLKHASYELRNDRQVILQAAKTIWHTCLLSRDLDVDFSNFSNDTEVVSTLINNCGFLSVAPKHIRSNREIALTAVKKHGYAINSISEDLQNDWEIHLEAMAFHPFSYYSTEHPYELMQNREFFFNYVRKPTMNMDGYLKNISMIRK